MSARRLVLVHHLVTRRCLSHCTAMRARRSRRLPPLLRPLDLSRPYPPCPPLPLPPLRLPLALPQPPLQPRLLLQLPPSHPPPQSRPLPQPIKRRGGAPPPSQCRPLHCTCAVLRPIGLQRVEMTPARSWSGVAHSLFSLCFVCLRCNSLSAQQPALKKLRTDSGAEGAHAT